MSIRIRDIDHVVVRARNPRDMERFYRDVLGCTEERRLDDIGLVQLRAGSSLIDVVDVASDLGRAGGAPPGRDGHNMDHFCVRVEPWNEEAIRAHLELHGVTAGSTERRSGAEGDGPSIYIEDPEGNTVELKGPPDD